MFDSDSGPPEDGYRDEHTCPRCQHSWLDDDDDASCPECGWESDVDNWDFTQDNAYDGGGPY